MTDASAAPDTTTAATEEDVHEQKAVRLAKRERLVANRADAGGEPSRSACP